MFRLSRRLSAVIVMTCPLGTACLMIAWPNTAWPSRGDQHRFYEAALENIQS
jgi:hypothetical protein